MRIVTVGAGALGCLVSACLAKSKEEVWILDKNKERAAHINQHGVNVEGIGGKWHISLKATIEPKEIKGPDLVIICVKSYHTKEAVKNVLSILEDDTKVLTLQNGMGNVEIISEVVGQEKVIGAVTNMGATLLNIGHVNYAGKGETIIGRMDGKISSQMRTIREIFNKAGLETKVSRDIKGIIWSKLIINVGINALTAITRLPNGRLLEFEGTHKILREAVSEATRIAKRKRIKLIYDDPLAKVEAVCEATACNICSMLQDVLKKKRTEIDFINGVIVRQGQELGIPVPVNSMLVDLVKTIEASYNLAIEN